MIMGTVTIVMDERKRQLPAFGLSACSGRRTNVDEGDRHAAGEALPGLDGPQPADECNRFGGRRAPPTGRKARNAERDPWNRHRLVLRVWRPTKP
jgi:hypothetical protein